MGSPELCHKEGSQTFPFNSVFECTLVASVAQRTMKRRFQVLRRLQRAREPINSASHVYVTILARQPRRSCCQCQRQQKRPLHQRLQSFSRLPTWGRRIRSVVYWGLFQIAYCWQSWKRHASPQLLSTHGIPPDTRRKMQEFLGPRALTHARWVSLLVKKKSTRACRSTILASRHVGVPREITASRSPQLVP